MYLQQKLIVEKDRTDLSEYTIWRDSYLAENKRRWAILERKGCEFIEKYKKNAGEELLLAQRR